MGGGANAVDHAHPAGRPGPVGLEATRSPDEVLECRTTDQGTRRPPDRTVTHRGRGLLLTDQLQAHHPPPGDAAGDGTQVHLRHRLHRSAMFASDSTAPPASRPRPSFEMEAEHDDAVYPDSAAPDGAAPDGQMRLRVRGPVDVATAER